MATLIVLGAGYVGREACRLGVLFGYDCIAVSRSSNEPPDGARWLSGDVLHRESLSALRKLSGPADLVVYAVSPGAPQASAYEAAYSQGPRNALEVFPEARFVLISSSRVFGHSTGAVDDEVRAEPDDVCASHIVSGEAAVLERSARNIVLRASGIYGPGRTRTADALIAATLAPGEEEVVTNRIHRDDLARLVFFLATQESGGTFIASDPHPTSLGAMQKELKRIARDTGFQPPFVVQTGRTRRTRNRVLKPSRLLALGFQFQFPSFREGYESIFSARPKL